MTSTTSTLRLYEATDALATVRDWIDENAERLTGSGGDLDAIPELAELLEQAEGDFTAKAERVALFVRELTRTAEGIDAEAVRLTQRAKAKKRAADSLKAYLLQNMIAADVPKIEGQLVTLRVQNSPPAVQCALDSAALKLLAQDCPTLVTIVPETYRLDAKALLAMSKAVGTMPRGITVTQSQHLRIL